MNKKLTMLVGVAAVGVAAYMLWKKSQKPKSFMNAAAGFCPDYCANNCDYMPICKSQCPHCQPQPKKQDL